MSELKEGVKVGDRIRFQEALDGTFQEPWNGTGRLSDLVSGGLWQFDVEEIRDIDGHVLFTGGNYTVTTEEIVEVLND